MVVALARDTNNQVRGVFVGELDAVGILHDDETGFDDVLFDSVFAVRNRNALPDVSRNIAFASQHAFDIFLFDVAALEQEFARRLDSLFFADRLQADFDVIFEQDAFLERGAAGFFFAAAVASGSLNAAALQAFADDVVNVVVGEVFNPNMFSLRRVCSCAFGKFFVADDNLRVLRNTADCEVFNCDIFVAVLLEFFAESSRAECAGAHARIASVSDKLNVFARDLLFVRRLTFAGSLHGFHVGLSRFEGVFLFGVRRRRCLDKD